MPVSMQEFKRNVQQKFLNQVNAAPGEPDEGREARGKKKGDKNTIDFQNSVCFYEDSEGDFNVISEDEDLIDASTYVTQKSQKALTCTIVGKKFYEDMRSEQTLSDLN